MKARIYTQLTILCFNQRWVCCPTINFLLIPRPITHLLLVLTYVGHTLALNEFIHNLFQTPFL